MSECDELLELSIECDIADDARFQRHVAWCSRCREELGADRELRQLFQGVVRPGPSLHFNRELRKRLHAERQRQRRYGLHLVVMQGYWAAAIVASIIVMVLIRWPSELPSPIVMWTLGAVFGAALITPLMLVRRLHIGPLGLILRTMQEFRRS